MSLARGPALVLGTILLAFGLYFIYKQHTFLKFSNFPNGDAPVQGKVFLGIFGANGWTGMLTAIAGGLLLFGAAQHLLARTMSLIVGICLGAAAVIAFISHNVLGLAAANHWTELGWAIAAAILLFNFVAGRRQRRAITEPVGAGTGRGRRRHTAEAAAVGAGAGAVAEHEHDRHKEERDAEHANERTAGARNGEPVARDGEPFAGRANGRAAGGDENAEGEDVADREHATASSPRSDA
jgi:lysylphosphatidylglycerol synthetase-like protein (DUF2156 family)